MSVEPETVMVAMLSASLALVRPVGMTAQETGDWLEVALDTLAHLPLAVFEKGVRTARQKCTHHSQIVPSIITETREDLVWHNRPKSPAPLRLVSDTPPAPKPPLVDPNTMSADLCRLGLTAGFLTERNGKLEWTQDETSTWAGDTAA